MHGISYDNLESGRDIIRLYDRVRIAQIGKGCEEHASLIYRTQAQLDDCLAYTKQEMGCYIGENFNIKLTDPTPYAAKAYRMSESDA